MYFTVRFQQQAFAQARLQELLLASSQWIEPNTFDELSRQSVADSDRTLWSAARIAAAERVDPAAAESAIAVLRVPSLSVQAPVFAGASDAELDRGPGWLRDTAEIGAIGNTAIAGHRDGYFRALKDIAAGDEIEVITPEQSVTYQVTDIWIVDPDAVHVLDQTDHAAITLVTCYPFYFVGSAPQRFIVRAVAL
jgi:sortase A